MSEENLRPRGTSEIIDAAFDLYRRNFSQYILVGALASAPGLILNIALTGGAQPKTPGDLLKVLPSLLVSLITMTLMAGIVQKVGSQTYLGGEVDLPTALRQVLPKLLSLIAASVLLAIMFMFGFLLVLIGAVFVGIRFFAVTQAIVLEDKGAFSGLKRSLQLTRGGDIQWHVFKTLMLLVLIYIVLLIVVTGIGSMITFDPAKLMVQTVFSLLVSPVVALSSMLLYYDLRIRKEAFDLERMTQALGAMPTPGVDGAPA